MNQELTKKVPPIDEQIDFIRGARHLLGQGIANNVAILEQHLPILLRIEENLIAVKIWDKTNAKTTVDLVIGTGAVVSELVAMLKECKLIIQNLHGLGMTPENAEESWKIFDAKSPEMLRLNAMLTKYEGLAEKGSYEFTKTMKEVGDV